MATLSVCWWLFYSRIENSLLIWPCLDPLDLLELELSSSLSWTPADSCLFYSGMLFCRSDFPWTGRLSTELAQSAPSSCQPASCSVYSTPTSPWRSQCRSPSPPPPRRSPPPLWEVWASSVHPHRARISGYWVWSAGRIRNEFYNFLLPAVFSFHLFWQVSGQTVSVVALQPTVTRETERL